MASKVYFANMRANSRESSLLNKINKLFKEAGCEKMVQENDLVAIKLHFGEKGNTGFIRPIYIRQIVNQVKERKGKPFLTDANTLYRGSRKNAVDHLNTAISNGFSYATVRAPVIIADGLRGKSFTEVEINKKHIKKAKISNEVYYADALIVVTHFKGHGGTGFGGTMKNVGMGIASPAGKQMMHANVLPSINKDKCIGCGKCKRWCPADAIEQASLDLVNAQQGLKNTALKSSFAAGEDKFKDLYPTVNVQRQISYAEKLGLGTREYNLIEV